MLHAADWKEVILRDGERRYIPIFASSGNPKEAMKCAVAGAAIGCETVASKEQREVDKRTMSERYKAQA